MSSRSQVDWRQPRRQRPVRNHKGHRQNNAVEYRFRSADFKLQREMSEEGDVIHGAILANWVALLYGV